MSKPGRLMTSKPDSPSGGPQLTKSSGRIRQARKLTRRRARAEANLFLAEGAQAVREALTENGDGSPGLVRELFLTPAAASRSPDLVNAARDAAVPVRYAEEAAMDSLSETVTPQGIVAVCRTVTVSLTEALTGRMGLVAILVNAQDPGNAGTVIRSADAAGADAIVLTSESVDPQGGKAVRASAGSLFHLPVTAGAPLSDAVNAARARGLTVLAAAGDGSIDLDAAADEGLLAGPTAWLFGSEAHGLERSARELANEVVRVPVYGRAESLNLSAAAAVCLYASARAHRHSYQQSPAGWP